MKNILVKPLVTEKTTKLMERLHQYAFVVNLDANKIEIKDAVEEMYGVTVERVNTSIRPRKQRTRFTKSGVISGKTKLIKKAIVTLAEGESIDFYENV